LVSQNIETDGAVGVDVRVVDLGREGDLGGFEGVVWEGQDAVVVRSLVTNIPVGKVRELPSSA
jgi:hypothetical protein